jgi:hypothetical protein
MDRVNYLFEVSRETGKAAEFKKDNSGLNNYSAGIYTRLSGLFTMLVIMISQLLHNVNAPANKNRMAIALPAASNTGLSYSSPA